MVDDADTVAALREAVTLANCMDGEERILLEAGTYTLGAGSGSLDLGVLSGVLRISGAAYYEQHTGAIHRLRGEEDYQQPQIAERLVQTAMANCKHHGYLKIRLDTRFDPDAVVDPAGTWAFSVATPDGEEEGTFTISGSASSLTGTIRTNETRDLQSVTLEGNVLTFTFTQPEMGSVRVSGVIDGDSFSGTASVGSLGSFSITATRRPN